MRRSQAAVLTISMTAVAILIEGVGFGITEILLLLLVLLATGIGPFMFGVVVRLLWKQETVPLAVPWAFGATLGVVRIIAPQLGGLIVMGSMPLAVLFTVLLGAAFAEIGIAAAGRMIGRRRSSGVTPREA